MTNVNKLMYWHPTSKLSCQCLKYEEWTLIIFHFVHALTPIIYQIFSGLVFSPPELRLQCLKIYLIEGLYGHGHALKFA